MRSYTQKTVLTAFITLAILILCPASQANTVTSNMTLTGVGISGYDAAKKIVGGNTTQVNVGPYTDVFSNYYGTANKSMPVFCLDLYVSTNANQAISGTLYTLDDLNTTKTNMSLQQAEEVSFLASYALYREEYNNVWIHDQINNKDVRVEGAIQMAIWKIMGTLGATPEDPTRPANTTITYAQTFASMALDAYNNGIIKPLSNFSVWAPDSFSASQRFVVAVKDDQLFAPEPGTTVFMGTGVLLIALGRIRRGRGKRS